MGNRAAGCHFRPYSFASSPFDDFAEMKNSTRKNRMSTPCRPLPLTGPRPSQIAALPNRKRAGEEASRQPDSARSAPPKQSRKSGSLPAQIDARGAASETRGASICAHPLPRQNYPLRRPAADRDRILSSFASLLQPTRHPHTSQELWGSIHIQIRITVLTLD